MNKGRILVVEDDKDVSKMLRIYFDSLGYEVLVSYRGKDALEMSRRQLPNIVVLDIMLPDIDGYEVCRRLRNNLRTSHIPILFLTQKDERSDKIAGLELGADDYITKPFDIEELKWRVQNALKRAQYENLTNPTTGLPSSKLVEEQLKQLMRRNGWTILYVGLNDFELFKEVHGFVAGDDVLRFVAMLLLFIHFETKKEGLCQSRTPMAMRGRSHSCLWPLAWCQKARLPTFARSPRLPPLPGGTTHIANLRRQPP